MRDAGRACLDGLRVSLMLICLAPMPLACLTLPRATTLRVQRPEMVLPMTLDPIAKLLHRRCCSCLKLGDCVAFVECGCLSQ
jgi:hypothetical protein